MTAAEHRPVGSPAPGAGVCALCGAPLAPSKTRCVACGMPPGLSTPAANPFSHRALWAMAGGLVAIYAIVLVMVVALR